MEANHFDRLTRLLAALPSRRHFLSVLATGLGLVTSALPALAEAKRKKLRKKNKKKVKVNAFGCVNVGKFCKNGGQCCSGICQGKKGKKRCQAHDASSCVPGQDECESETSCTTSTGDEGLCFTTTGNAGYCGADIVCFPCTQDVDCQAFCGAAAACVLCAGCQDEGGFACVGVTSNDCNET